jgi:putative PIN family toxin of toxin-antitoxin system
VRVVLDKNVIISAAISRNGPPALIIRAWIDGEFELIVSKRLLGEIQRALAYTKVASRIDSDEAIELIEVLERHGTLGADPIEPPGVGARDNADNFLLALAEAKSALLVSGDAHFLELSDRIPVVPPRQFVKHLEQCKGAAGRVECPSRA